MSAAKEDNVPQVGELVFEGRTRMAVPIERAALRDARLSWAARGLFAFLWDLPENWRPCLTHLANMGTDRAHATRSAMAELEKVGGMRVEKLRGPGGRLAGQRWVVVSAARWAIEAPLKGGREGIGGAASPECDFPSMGFSEAREIRVSENCKLRVSKHKGIQTQGSPNTTTTAARAAVDQEAASPRGGSFEIKEAKDVVWPAALTADQLAGAQRVLLGNEWPGISDAQALLDELAGVIAQGKARNPVGLLRRLLQRLKAGEFTRDVGPEVRQAREARRRHEERLSRPAVVVPAVQTQQPAGQSEVAKTELEKLRLFTQQARGTVRFQQ